jgi:hypothetical protein
LPRHAIITPHQHGSTTPRQPQHPKKLLSQDRPVRFFPLFLFPKGVLVRGEQVAGGLYFVIGSLKNGGSGWIIKV